MHRNHFFSRLYVRTILCAVLCGAVIFCFTGCGGGSGDDSASVQTTAEERGKGAEMDPEKKAQLQKDQENGLFLLVNKDPENHLDPSYKAEDLEPIKYYAADRNKYTRFMRAEAAEAFHRLVETAAEEGIDIVMTTAYRSYEFQQILWDNYVAQKGEEEANKTSARPGESEHQTGLALDVSCPAVSLNLSQAFSETAEGRWLARHAPLYGFIIRYPKGKEHLTKIPAEPWHIRYVTRSLALCLTLTGQVLEEYYACCER